MLVAATDLLQSEDARTVAEILLMHVLDRSRSWLYTWPESEPDTVQCALFDRLVAARRGGVPVAYLTGRRAFWSLDLAVTPAVLIPRPETELLVELALARLPRDTPRVAADLGTGCGAIALVLASERPLARVTATDASADALAVARANAGRLDIGNIRFVQGDWCAALATACFDVIVSNPPYIAAGDPHLAVGDLRQEPVDALVAGTDGLAAIRAIVAAAPNHLDDGAWLLLEHGWEQGEAVRALLRERGFIRVETQCDIGGRERVSLGCWRA